jgi:DNA-binding winged helix-turn-helix (wHTH) protein
MRSGFAVHRFGPFELDPATGRVFHGPRRVRLSDPHARILVRMAANAGKVFSREALLEIGWPKVAVTPNSAEQAIRRIRKALGDPGDRYIETVPGRGYRFIARIDHGERPIDDAPADANLVPFLAFEQGRVDVSTLILNRIRRARDRFRRALDDQPDYAPAHVGLANACALIFEATTLDAVCDVDALREALAHARRGTELAPSSGDAWSTLAFALYLNGDDREAIAAARKAIAHEPDDWRHYVRLAYVSWGEERLRAARTVLTLRPGLALACWLIATVFIARGAFAAALAVVREGCAAQDAQSPENAAYPAVGLHLLHALILAEQGRLDEALSQLECELACRSGQLYARECAANCWYARGAILRRQRRHQEADTAFAHAREIAPGHVFAAAAMRQELSSIPGRRDPRFADAAIAAAARLACDGRHADAARACCDALAAASSPRAGWILPVEPLLNPSAHPDIWAGVLATVCDRAT